MKTVLGILGLTLVLVTVGAQPALADPPPGSFDIDFSGGAAIWNPFDGFQACESILGATLCLDIIGVACDGKGRCVGDAQWSLSGALGGATAGPAQMTATCRPNAPANRPVCKAKLKFDTNGTITAPGVSCQAEIDGSVGGPVSAGGFFDAIGKVKICLNCSNGSRGCQSGRGTFPYDVNPPTPWSLTVQLAPSGKKLGGSATDSLGFSYTAKGSYNAKKDESKVALKGDKGTAGEGAKVMLKNLVTVGNAVTDGSASVTVQGTKSTKDLEP